MKDPGRERGDERGGETIVDAPGTTPPDIASKPTRGPRIVYVTAGAAGRYCGNCLRDNALALALKRRGEEILLVPTYTPIRADEEDASERRVFFNGVRVYLEQKWAWYRRPRAIADRLLGNVWLLRGLSSLGRGTDPRVLGELTISMLDGELGHQRKELDELLAWLSDVKPDVVHLSNVLLVGMARSIRKSLGVPVVCGLQAEDSFIDYLPETFRDSAVERIAERGREVDRLVAVSRYYADYSAARFGLPRERISVVLPGVHHPTDLPDRSRAGEDLTIGYLGRLSPEKGAHLVVDAFVELAKRFPKLRLVIAGYVAPERRAYVRKLERRWRAAGLAGRVELLGTVDLAGKREFLRSIDLLCAPPVQPDPKGLSAIEGLAHGVPFVAASQGIFPELAELTGGGLLCAPNDAASVRDAIEALVLDVDRRREMGERGRAVAFERLTADRMAEDTLAIYRALTSRAAR